MAKIILVSPKTNATTWQLVQALKAQQHDVVLLTSYGESVENTHGIEFMAYFKRWSFLEGVRIIPGLFGLQAQILHLLLEEDTLNPAQLVLATYAKSHPYCILTTSLLHIRKGLSRRNPVRYLIEESDIVTCPTLETMGELRGLNIRTRRQGRSILPPVLSTDTPVEAAHLEIIESEQKVLTHLHGKRYVLLPFHEKNFEAHSDFFQRVRLLAQKYTVVLWGTYSHWSLRQRKQFQNFMAENDFQNKWLVTGDISSSLTQTLMHQSEALLLAGLSLTPVELTDYFMKALHSDCTLILDSSQSSVHATLWKNSKNCWIINQTNVNDELSRLLQKPQLKTPEPLSKQISFEKQWLDYPLNELNRLYNRALDQKA